MNTFLGMESFRTKYILSLAVFVIGACMAITPVLTKGSFELLLPGSALIALSTPFLFYFYARSKSTHHTKSDEELIMEAKQEAELRKGESDGKK